MIRVRYLLCEKVGVKKFLNFHLIDFKRLLKYGTIKAFKVHVRWLDELMTTECWHLEYTIVHEK